MTLWRKDAVLSHGTAGWLHGICPEPGVIKAYVSSTPPDVVPSWLRLHVAPLESYAMDTVLL